MDVQRGQSAVLDPSHEHAQAAWPAGNFKSSHEMSRQRVQLAFLDTTASITGNAVSLVRPGIGTSAGYHDKHERVNDENDDENAIVNENAPPCTAPRSLLPACFRLGWVGRPPMSPPSATGQRATQAM
eukprot:365728-Chlamydomonas_euryale.AAC.12